MFFSNHLAFLNHNGTNRSSILFQKCASYNKDNERDKIFHREIKTALHCMAYFRTTDSTCNYATLLCNTINIHRMICLDVTEAAGLYKGNRYFNTILLCMTIHI